MQKIIILSAVCLFINCRKLVAQQNFWNSPDAYLGQTPPGDTPKIFAPGMLADPGFYACDRPAFSKDGKEIYYCTNNTWYDAKNLKIKYFKYEDGAWKGPSVLNEHHYAPIFSPDQKIFYFNRDPFLCASQKKQHGWTIPINAVSASYTLYDFVPTKSGNNYGGTNKFKGPKSRLGNFDVCKMSISGTDTAIYSLGVPLNAPGWNGDFFISPDESFIIISDKETKDYECELFISYRKADKTWTNPKSLGPLINNGPAHRWGQIVTPDNKYLFYTFCNRKNYCELHWVRFDGLLKKLKHTNFDPYVSDSLGDQQIDAEKSFSIPIPQKTFVDDDGAATLSYRASLVNGGPLPAWMHFDAAKKILSGKAPGSGSFPISITVTDTGKSTASTRFAITVTGNRN